MVLNNGNPRERDVITVFQARSDEHCITKGVLPGIPWDSNNTRSSGKAGEGNGHVRIRKGMVLDVLRRGRDLARMKTLQRHKV